MTEVVLISYALLQLFGLFVYSFFHHVVLSRRSLREGLRTQTACERATLFSFASLLQPSSFKVAEQSFQTKDTCPYKWRFFSVLFCSLVVSFLCFFPCFFFCVALVGCDGFTPRFHRLLQPSSFKVAEQSSPLVVFFLFCRFGMGCVRSAFHQRSCSAYCRCSLLKKVFLIFVYVHIFVYLLFLFYRVVLSCRSLWEGLRFILFLCFFLLFIQTSSSKPVYPDPTGLDPL